MIDDNEFEEELEWPAGVTGGIPIPCDVHNKLDCLRCDVYELNLRIYDLEDKVWKMERQNKKLRKALKKLL